jgi:arsenite-transporting ATPase
MGSQLDSLKSLVEDIETSVKSGDPPRVVFVGGKGGVGKTTISSALAVSLTSSYEQDLKVLIISTDPAHSLGDALDVDLRSSKGKPMVMTDPLTGGRLYACEVDAAAALDEFRSSLAAFDINRLADALGVSTSLLESFGLQEFSGLLNNPPPGTDELVALSNVLDPNSVAASFDVVIVDTAPTGHTLRLLALPQFLDTFLGKLIQLRLKLSGK